VVIRASKFQAPITAKTTITTPGGLNLNETVTRTAVLSNPANLLSLTTQTDTQNVNGRIYTKVFTAANRHLYQDFATKPHRRGND